MSPALFQAAAILLFAIAVWRDVATRIIPDGVSLALALAGLLSRAAGAGFEAAAWSLAVGAGCFLLLLPLVMRGALGGGDMKLASAMMLGLPPHLAWDFVFATVMLGGVLALPYLAGPALVPPARPAAAAARGGRPGLLRRVLAAEAWRLRRRGPLPYGVAIAGGGLLVLLTSPGP